MITEGKLADKEPEFYFIQKGDCLLEKEHTINVVSPYAREQPVIQDKKHLPLTKISNIYNEIVFKYLNRSRYHPW